MTLLESRIRNIFWLEMDQSNKDALHDAVVNGDVLSEKELRLVYNTLPFDIICDALKWGFSDTEVRDSVYTHVMNLTRNLSDD